MMFSMWIVLYVYTVSTVCTVCTVYVICDAELVKHRRTAMGLAALRVRKTKRQA
jgi:hypothetical protein